MDNVVDDIEECKKANGFIMAYPEEETDLSENANLFKPGKFIFAIFLPPETHGVPIHDTGFGSKKWLM